MINELINTLEKARDELQLFLDIATEKDNEESCMPEINRTLEKARKELKQRQETRPHETIVMWRSVDEQLPECEEEEYAVTDGQSFYMAYYGFNHKTKKTEFSSTSDDFDSLHGCKGITHWAKIDDSVIIAT